MKNVQDLSHVTERNYIYALKAFAIISIVSAHCGILAVNTNQLNIIFSLILGQIGTIGVGIFFILSGYLFYKNKNSFGVFFLKKIKTVLMPWIVVGTAVYFYVFFRKGGIGLNSWFDFLVGNGSYLYYLTLLIIFYLLFFYTAKNKMFVFSMIILSVLSIVLTSIGVLKAINPYLNPLNFMCYFGFGLMIANKNVLLKIAYKCANYKLLLSSLFVSGLVLTQMLDITSGYWGYATLIMQPIATLMIFGFATMRFVYGEKIIELGIESFAIYLLHMPIAGLITFIFNRYNLWLLTLLRPLIVIGITIVFIYIYKCIGNKLKIDYFTNKILGIK